MKLIASSLIYMKSKLSTPRRPSGPKSSAHIFSGFYGRRAPHASPALLRICTRTESMEKKSLSDSQTQTENIESSKQQFIRLRKTGNCNFNLRNDCSSRIETGRSSSLLRIGKTPTFVVKMNSLIYEIPNRKMYTPVCVVQTPAS